MAGPMPQGGPPPGVQQPSPEQIRAMQEQLQAEAQRHGMTVPQYIQKMREAAMAQQQAQMQATPEQIAQMRQLQQQMQQQQQQGGQPTPEQIAKMRQMQQQIQQQQQQQQQQGGQLRPPQQQQQQQPPHPQGQPQPIQPGPPTPEALAVAGFLRSQELKIRMVVHDEKRKEMFRVKRAIRALQSPAYEKARKKNPLLPAVTDRATAENTFKLLPMSLLALRVSKVDPAAHEGHNHAKPKRVKGLWTVRIEQHQDTDDDHYYIWLWEGSQLRMKLYALGALVAVMAVVFFPLWPMFMRRGVWYISMFLLGCLGLFFAMAIVRLILFIITMFAAPPGLWLYPNLFEDVSFMDSFRPVWAWQETAEDIKAKKLARKQKRADKAAAKAAGVPYKSKKKGAAAATAAAPGAVAPPSEPNVPASAETAAPAAAPSAPVDEAPKPTGAEVGGGENAVTQRKHATVEEAEEE